MKLLDQGRAKIRTLHYSYRAGQTYVRWIATFIRFHQLRHPSGMGGPEIEQLLTHLAIERQVSASTQNQSLNAAIFLYKRIIRKEPGEIKAVRATPWRGETAVAAKLADPALQILLSHISRRESSSIRRTSSGRSSHRAQPGTLSLCL